MINKEITDNSEKRFFDIERITKALWRAVEGDAKDPADWLSNARLNIYTPQGQNTVSVNTTEKVLLTQSIYTGGGVMLVFATVIGEASNAVINIKAKVGSTTITPICSFSINGVFSKMFVFSRNLAKGEHQMQLLINSNYGTGTVLAGNSKLIILAPSKKF